MKRLALIGSKEFAQQIRHFAEYAGGFDTVGYFDDFENKGTVIEGLPILGHYDDILEEYNKGTFDEIFLASGYNNFQFREYAFTQLKGKVPFATIIDPSAEICRDVKLGEGVYVGRNTIIDDCAVVDDNVFIHRNCLIGHDSHVHSHSYISGLDHMAGFCEIGARTFIGLSVCIADHIKIADDVWVGIGCIVAKNIKKPGKYMTESVLLTKIG